MVGDVVVDVAVRRGPFGGPVVAMVPVGFGEVESRPKALGTEGEIGYVVTDVAQRPDQRALDQLASIEGTIRMRVIS